MIRSIFFRFLLATALIFIITGCDDVTDPDLNEDPTEFVEYEMVWNDEFDGSTLSTSNWGYDIGYGSDGWGNDEWQEYTDEPGNVRVENGNLVISANYDSVNYSSPGKRDGSITSARIKTQGKYSFKYGKVQARIKPPVSMGMWPAFWMLGTSYEGAGWPYCGEIDIMEMSPLYQGPNTSMFTLHWWDDETESHTYDGSTRVFDYSLGDDYHIFETEWDDQRIVGKIDGITYYVKLIDPDTMNEFLREFFLILNVAVGGNLGGDPDDTTVWEESMYVDWVRVYQGESNEEAITSFGIFTDNTEVDAGITVGLDAEIYVWENTLEGSTTAPYEGDNVISWATTGIGWFGGGIASNSPVDLSGFSEGFLKFMIKIPANVTFKIGINDISGNENYVTFPADQVAYGLTRNGDWGQAMIPLSELKGNVDQSLLSYEFIILEENGTQCSFAIDDIYYDGGGTTASSISFDADTYSFDAASAEIAVIDEGAASSSAQVSVGNGTDTITIEIMLDDNGEGTGTLNFGATNDETDTIDISSTTGITASYTDSEGTERTDSASIENNQEPAVAAPVPAQNAADVISIYSDSYTDLSGTNLSPDWGQTTMVSFEDIGGNEMMKYDVFNYQGIELSGAQDLSGMGYLHVDMWTNNATVVKVTPISQLYAEYLVSMTPINSGTWNSYDIPLSDFTGVQMIDIYQLKFDCQDGVTPSTVYLDNIYFYSANQTNSAGIYSESHINPLLSYTIINSADWGGNVVDVDLESTEVTPVDGSFAMSLDFNSGASWGGIACDFGTPGTDMTAYNIFVININSSALSDFANLKIKIEHTGTNAFEIDTSSYTPVMNGDWARYEIPLSDFTGVDLSDVHYLVLSNPQNSSGSALFGKLYLDDIYIEE